MSNRPTASYVKIRAANLAAFSKRAVAAEFFRTTLFLPRSFFLGNSHKRDDGVGGGGGEPRK